MVQTRHADKSAQDKAQQDKTIEQPTENTRESPVVTSEKEVSNPPDEQKDDSASKARERMDRFKALKARAVCKP